MPPPWQDLILIVRRVKNWDNTGPDVKRGTVEGCISPTSPDTILNRPHRELSDGSVSPHLFRYIIRKLGFLHEITTRLGAFRYGVNVVRVSALKRVVQAAGG